MKASEFEAILAEQVTRIVSILGVKTLEYATDEDQLKNIREAAALQDTTMQEAVAGMMAKHTVSIYAMVRNSDREYPPTMWDEKITDHIIWLILLRAVLEETYNERETSGA